jgi:hypothetical protein
VLAGLQGRFGWIPSICCHFLEKAPHLGVDIEIDTLWMGIITKLIGCNQGEPDLSPRPHRLVKAVVLVCPLVSEAGWIPVSVGQVPMSIDDIYTHLYWSKIIEKISIYLHM